MILTPQQVKVFEKALAATAGVLQKLQFLQQLGEAMPELKERVDTLATQREYLYRLASMALDLNAAAESAANSLEG